MTVEQRLAPGNRVGPTGGLAGLEGTVRQSVAARRD